MRNLALVLIAVSMPVAPANGQPATPSAKIQGSIDGQPIRDSVFAKPSRQDSELVFELQHGRPASTAADQQAITEYQQTIVCQKLGSAIREAARKAQKAQLGAAVTPEDIEAARREVTPMDPVATAARMREEATAVLAALSAVYDRQQDPDQVYEKDVRSHGISKTAWTMYLRRGRTPEGRANLVKQANASPEAISQAASTFDFRPRAEEQKLDRLVDEKIAADDPVFRTYLAEWHAAFDNPDPKKHWMRQERVEYIQQKRAQWWKAQVAKLNVQLSDPSLGDACALGKLGVAWARQ